MQYYCLHYLIAHGVEERVNIVCSTYDFYNYVFTTRVDNMQDAIFYCDSAAQADRMQRAFEPLAIELSERRCVSEEDLLAAHNPLSPLALTERVCIFPEVIPETIPDIHNKELVLHIPPGPAFGDGHHPTTQMAARLLDECACVGKRVLDMGSGTGVLGLIAHKRGAERVDFSDIDEDSVRFTRDVCVLNGYPQAQVFASDLLEHCHGTYDLVIANIYADLLLVLFDDPALNTVLPQGQILLSGISYKRIDEVLALVAEKGFTIEHHINQEWWHGMLLSR